MKNDIDEAPIITPSFDNLESLKQEVVQRQELHRSKLKELFLILIQNSIAIHLQSKEDAEHLYSNVALMIDEPNIEQGLLPVKVKDLSREDLFRLGFYVKYYLKQRNDFGAAFIYKVFNEEFQRTGTRNEVEFNVICRKLSSNEALKHSISFPSSYTRRGNVVKLLPPMKILRAI